MEFFEQLQDRFEYQCDILSKNLEIFFHELSFRHGIYLQYKFQVDRFLSSDFSFFQYLGTDENSLSDYIGMLLNTNGSHGQQKLFLDLFVEYLNDKGIDVPNYEFQVHREYSADGRIDIFLHYDKNKTAVIIENKPYSPDMKKQLERYYNEILRNYIDIFVIYLSPGNDPTAYSIPTDILEELKKKNRFKTIHLNEFGRVYLKKCLQLCESQKFRFFLNDFIQFLESTFKQNQEEIHGSN